MFYKQIRKIKHALLEVFWQEFGFNLTRNVHKVCL